MKKIFTSSIFLIFLISVSTQSGFAQSVLLYQNSFESPNMTPVTTCSPDLDNHQVNTLWGGTGTGTGGGGLFKQVNTVETILINGQYDQFTDSSGLGGNYCLGMLSTFQNDKVALILNSQGLPYANISFLMSPIDLPQCGGPFGLDTSAMHITIYDSPGGNFSFSSPGTMLDEDTVIGSAPGATPYSFNWSLCATSLDIRNTVDSNITIVFDLIRSGYAAIDSITITSSISPGFIQEHSGLSSVMVSPNPSHGDFNISIKKFPKEKTFLTLTDLYGRKLQEIKIESENTSLNLVQPNGIYFATITTDATVYTTKIIIQH